jgi:hypothetical protein
MQLWFLGTKNVSPLKTPKATDKEEIDQQFLSAGSHSFFSFYFSLVIYPTVK